MKIVMGHALVAHFKDQKELMLKLDEVLYYSKWLDIMVSTILRARGGTPPLLTYDVHLGEPIHIPSNGDATV